MITRRTFAALTVAGVLALASNAHAEDKLGFELYEDKAKEFRWRLKATNGNTLATSGQGYATKAGAKEAIENLRTKVGDYMFEVYEDKAKEYRWRAKAKNGQVVAASSEGYKRRADLEKAVELIKTGAKDAKLTDLTSK